jgi:hypothetical protein
MEGISTYVRAEHCQDEKASSTQHKVLERIDWLHYLNVIFNKTANDTAIRTSSSSITVEAFLNTLIESVSVSHSQDLPLVDAHDFAARSRVQALTLEEVFMCFEADFGKTLTWDDIMDQVMQLKRVSYEEAESPRSIDVNELVYISRRSNSSGEMPGEEFTRSPRIKSDLRIPQTPPSHSQEFPIQVFEPVLSASLPSFTPEQSRQRSSHPHHQGFPRSNPSRSPQHNQDQLSSNSARKGYLLGHRHQPVEDEALDLSYPEGTSESLEVSLEKYAGRKLLSVTFS